METEIIVVDDDPIAGALVCEVLGMAGYRTQLVNESSAAIPAVRSAKPRLVLLDIIMPGTDGLTLCKEIKKDPDLRATRVVIVSGKSFAEEKQRAKIAGADLFIAKPFDLDTFSRLVADLIGPPRAT